MNKIEEKLYNKYHVKLERIDYLFVVVVLLNIVICLFILNIVAVLAWILVLSGVYRIGILNKRIFMLEALRGIRK